MSRIALLIGTGEYSQGFNALPAAPKDVAALEAVLNEQEMGGFDQVTTLVNQSHNQISEKIETWFREHEADDLALLYISGHGVKDAQRELYFAASNTRKEREELVVSTAVAARFVHECSRRSKAKRQIIILDCCFSGAYGDLLVRDDGTVDLEEILGAEGRVVMTASNSTEYSFEQRDGELSTYTSYLVEGIRTGAADLNGDGKIDVKEFHQYVSRNVQEVSPEMNPKIIVVKDEGYLLRVANAPWGDPKVKYRKAIGEIAAEDDGEISFINRFTIEELQQKLKIDSEEAAQIEFEVLEPYRQRKSKIDRYRQIFTQAIQKPYPLQEKELAALKRLQNTLGFRDEDAKKIEEQIITEIQPVSAEESTLLEKNRQNSPAVVQTSISLSDGDALNSDRDIDYSYLRDCLEAGDWQNADMETYRILAQSMNKEEGSPFTPEEILEFPCADLQTIDRLWTKYSDGVFGFSVQRKIYLGAGGKPLGAVESNPRVWIKYVEQVGWGLDSKTIEYSELVDEISLAPEGHFPCGLFMWGLGLGTRSYLWIPMGAAFFSRLTSCRL